MPILRLKTPPRAANSTGLSRLKLKSLPSQVRAHNLSSKFRGFSGPVGCIAGETVIDGTGYTIAELQQKQIAPVVHTLIGPRQATVPFIKGTADLYEVKLLSGASVLVTEHHLFFGRCRPRNTAEGAERRSRHTEARWLETRVLRPGDRLLVAATSLPPTNHPCEGQVPVKWVAIASITYVRTDVFYDLTVEDAEHYFAHGIVHHNSGKSRWLCEAVCVAASMNRGRTGLLGAPCYDDQTEILTRDRGWKLFRELLPTDTVATLVEGTRLEFEKPLEIFDYPYCGDLIELRNQEIDLAMTPHHRCYTRFKNGQWQIKTAEELYGKHDWRFKKTVVNPENDEPGSEAYFEYLGLWFAEGCAEANPKRRKWRVTITQSKYPELVERILNDLGWKYSKDPRTNGGFNFVVYSKALAEQLVQYGKCGTKAVPNWIKHSSVRLLRSFLRGFIAGDGHAKVARHDQTQMWTGSAQLANDLQEIAFLAGYTANISCRARVRPGRNLLEYYICIRTSKKHEPYTEPKHWSKRAYDGRVYCVQVPSGIVYVRRNGKACWCGNTYPMLRDATLPSLYEAMDRLEIRYHLAKSSMVLHFLDFGTKLLCRAVENFDRLRGTNLAFFALDETSYCPEMAWQQLEARLRDPAGKLLVGLGAWTPKGHDWVYRRFIKNQLPNYQAVLANPMENTYLPSDFYSNLLNSYSREFAQQEVLGRYLNVFQGRAYASFLNESPGNVWRKEGPNFRNLAPCHYTIHRPILWALDFNVTPATSVICQTVPQLDRIRLGSSISGQGDDKHFVQLNVLDEIYMQNINTYQHVEAFWKKIEHKLLPAPYRLHIIVYGDASGGRRQSSASRSDYQIINDFFSRHKDRVVVEYRVPKANPEVVDRVNSVNAMCQTYTGNRRLCVHERCEELIRDLDEVIFDKDGNDNVLAQLSTKDKTRTHVSDALGYLIFEEFGLRSSVGESSERLIV